MQRIVGLIFVKKVLLGKFAFLNVVINDLAHDVFDSEK